MQLHAFDHDLQMVTASQATKQTDYLCFECGGVVRVRGGDHRRPHFYHLAPVRSCRQNGKSMEHIQTQCHLLSFLPQGEAMLEHPFPTVGRVADVVWFPKRLVFEVQCSPITRQEVIAREKDYASVGFSVVWILHDRQFNQWCLSAAEQTLILGLRYYTDMNGEGKGIFYDQWEAIEKGRRHHRFSRLPVDLSKPREIQEKSIFFPLLKRRLSSPYCFEGDLLHTFFTQGEGAPCFQEIAFFLPSSPPRLSWIERYVCRPYQSLLHFLLERSC